MAQGKAALQRVPAGRTASLTFLSGSGRHILPALQTKAQCQGLTSKQLKTNQPCHGGAQIITDRSSRVASRATDGCSFAQSHFRSLQGPGLSFHPSPQYPTKFTHNTWVHKEMSSSRSAAHVSERRGRVQQAAAGPFPLAANGGVRGGQGSPAALRPLARQDTSGGQP